MPKRTVPFVAVALATALTGCSQGTTALKTANEPVSQAAAVASPFYVDPSSNPAVWVKQHPGDARAARIKKSIAQRPIARWFGNWSGDIGKAVSAYVGAAQKAKKTPVLVAYNITDRDCHGQSSGGAGSAAKYRTWIAGFAKAIGSRSAVVVIEPDAVAQLDCLPANARTTRVALLKYATEQFKAKAPKAKVYLDGGNARWVAPKTMAQRLNSAGLKNVRGFAVNVSNFYATAESAAYAKKVNGALSGSYHYTRNFVIDTSRNGNGGKPGEWCNPAGRKLGTAPRTGGGAEMLLWIKVPGDSDGSCGVGGGVPAGTFSPALAVRLIDGK